MPINSAKSAKSLPGIESVNTHREIETSACTHAERKVKRAELGFRGSLQKTFLQYGLTRLDISLQENNPESPVLISAPCEIQGESTNEAQTRLSLLIGKAGILSLKEAFSFHTSADCTHGMVSRPFASFY